MREVARIDREFNTANLEGEVMWNPTVEAISKESVDMVYDILRPANEGVALIVWR